MHESWPFFNLRSKWFFHFLPCFVFLERNGAEPRSSLRGIDVNRPATSMYDEEVIVSSPNSTVSSVSGKRSEREENEAERASSSMEDDGGDAAARKKLRLSKEQAAVLEDTFKDHNTLNPVSGNFGKWLFQSIHSSIQGVLSKRVVLCATKC